MDERKKNILITILYFIIAIVVLGTSGIWLPFIGKDFNGQAIENSDWLAYAGNILTYSLTLFFVAIVDRVMHLLFKTGRYSNNVIEFLLIIIVSFLLGWLVVYKALKALRYDEVSRAIYYSFILGICSWAAWWYVKIQGSRANNFAPLGGTI